MDITYFSQNDSGAWRYKNDCGAACAAMLLAWQKLLGALTIDALAAETALASSDTGLSCGQVAALLLRHNLDARVESGLTLTTLKAHLDAGRPAILLVNDGYLSARQDQRYTGGHFIVAAGYTDTAILCNDPDRISGSTWGKDVPYPQREIDAALANIRDTGGASRSGIVCYGVLAVTVAYPMQTFGALNLRVGPAISATVLATMPSGAMVNVLTDPETVANGYTWVRVQWGTLVGWCARMFLVTPTTYPVGSDLSHHNAALPSSGAFLWHKATEGTGFVDPAYAARKVQWPKLWGAYHFGTGGNVSAQVDKFLAVAGCDGMTALALDLEANPDTSGTSESSMSLAQAAQFAAEVQALTGIWPVLYSNANYLRRLNDGSVAAANALKVLANCPLWVADANAEVPPGWSSWTFQQYALTNGIDTDRFNGSAVAAWWANFAPKAAATVQTLQVIAPDGVNVRAGPGTGYARVGGLVKGAVIRVILGDGWGRIVSGPYLNQYVCAQYLGALITRRTRPAMGVHYIGPGAFVDLQKAMRSCQVPFAVDVNETGAGQWIKANSPGTVMLFRVRGQDPSVDYGTGKARVEQLLPAFLASGADYLSTANEWIDDSSPAALAACCQQYLEAMDAMKAHGLTGRMTVGDFSTHHPDLAVPGMLAALRPMLTRAVLDGCPLNMHVYLTGGDPATDPGVWQQIAREFPGLKIIIGELGIRENDGAMTEQGFRNLLAYESILDAFGTQVIGAALYTLTDTTWQQCRWDSWIGAYAAHVQAWR